MAEALDPREVNSQIDSSVAKQYDRQTPKEGQWKDRYELIDGKKMSMLSTYRQGVGPVGRSMAVAKRSGPDILYLANRHSKKFQDLDKNKEVQIIFQDSKTQDWISISGAATTASSDDPRVKELYTSGVSAWFGDLKDGVHDGTWKDPQMSLIEVHSKYIVYWKETSSLGFQKEVGTAALTGGVAQTWVLREFTEEDIMQERE
ncbi:uncharacterized protein Z519_02988 [Cladophialophora bantiana CBS 173.52]|uniref:General stress protein FMN-binding split barrel domain-containing protein n=1 Tax=Cladophialophora bantiana (strain ATCC 10958 / CBS 173.52 / CDC B-1940 / NIH 8579) TaxID=1442370 RepID=A0A0D2GBJ1_CLAB1|nr:uncharacterized protein Z519_02988 [Cladophialophora bantiana CBS 173.52]KIW95922.1 hypothetical protein Z519_02988 [Cladophialophora bantiana CBS 173.52]